MDKEIVINCLIESELYRIVKTISEGYDEDFWFYLTKEEIKEKRKNIISDIARQIEAFSKKYNVEINIVKDKLFYIIDKAIADKSLRKTEYEKLKEFIEESEK